MKLCELGECSDCGAAMVRKWNAAGTDFGWVDTQGSRFGDDGTGPDGVTTVGEFVAWLRDNDPTLATYSLWKAKVDFGCGIVPWQHWHHTQTRPMVYEPGEVLPYCCDQPMQAARDGWLCRNSECSSRAVGPDPSAGFRAAAAAS